MNTFHTLGSEPVMYRTIRVEGQDIFYREAGPKDAPVLLLLHGFPSSSRMYQPLLESSLATNYHLIAPDFPGFGHSSWPTPESFTYTFDHLAQVMQACADALGPERYTLYLQDYGGPVGLRMAIAHPEKVSALIIQNAVAHEDGLTPLWAARRAFWQDRAAHEAALRAKFLSLAATRQRHVGSSAHPERIDPDRWTDEFYFLNQPGQAAIQSDLFFDYQTNVKVYPVWQQWLREHQPRLLVLWARTILPSRWPGPKLTAGTCLRRRSTSSKTPDTSLPKTNPRKSSPWSTPFWRPDGGSRPRYLL
jgi:pimeloyl-ACP methyl ester carboxylesterase